MYDLTSSSAYISSYSRSKNTDVGASYIIRSILMTDIKTTLNSYLNIHMSWKFLYNAIPKPDSKSRVSRSKDSRN